MSFSFLVWLHLNSHRDVVAAGVVFVDVVDIVGVIVAGVVIVVVVAAEDVDIVATVVVFPDNC